MANKATTQKIARSAVTGRIVTPGYAKSHPKTTIVQTVKTSRSGKK